MQLEVVLDLVFKRLPRLRSDIANTLVRYLPSMCTVLGIAGIGIAIFNLLNPNPKDATAFLSQANHVLSTVFIAIASVILFGARAPLKKQTAAGWRMLYYLSLLVLLLLIVTGNMAGLLILFIILYLLHEIKHAYVVGD